MKENAMLFANTDLRFVNKEITPFGGLSLFFKMLERCRFDEVLDGCEIPQQGSNRGYAPKQLIKGLFAGVWCGASRYAHLDLVRYDGALCKMIGWDRGAGTKRISAILRNSRRVSTRGCSAKCTNGSSTT